MVIPNWLSKHLAASDLQALEKHIERIESKSDVEIVPIIVRASSVYGQTRITLLLVFSLISVIFLQQLELSWHWGNPIINALLLFGLIVLSVGMSYVLARFGVVKMWMTHRFVEAEQCWRRAEIEFYHGRVSRTEKRNGILLYISLLERRVIVRGDQMVRQRVDESLWRHIVDEVIKGIKKGKMADGITSALKHMEDLLCEQIPLQSKEQNVLPNTFIIKE